VIQELKVGEALVSMLKGGGEPSIAQRTLIRPPSARVGPVSEAERKAKIEASPLYGKYERAVDRPSAYEMLKKRATQSSADAWGSILLGGGGRRQGYGEAFAKSIVRAVASGIGRKSWGRSSADGA